MKNSMCISLVISLITFGCAFQKAWSDDLLTRDQAISILIEQVINPDKNKDNMMVFGPQSQLQKGDVVEPAFLSTKNSDELIYKIQNPKWFFWIDDNPLNDMFVHTTRFVYIDSKHPNPTIGDGIIIKEVGWWPKINGQQLYRSSSERTNSPDRVYGSRPSFRDILRSRDAK